MLALVAPEEVEVAELCLFCEHYDETVDYCDLGLLETDEKFMERDAGEVEECLFYTPIGGWFWFRGE